MDLSITINCCIMNPNLTMKILKPLSSYLSKREFSTNNEHIFLELNYSGVPKDTLEPIENEINGLCSYKKKKHLH